MPSRTDIASGRGSAKKKAKPNTNRTVPVEVKSDDSMRTIVFPNMKRVCTIFLFFLGSFSIGFGAGYGAGFASKECL
jgi:hypothetical protein